MSLRFPTRRRALLWAALLFALAHTSASARPDFKVHAPPAWVQTIAPPADAGKNQPEDGLRCMLDDRQVRVTDAGPESYSHFVQQVTTAAAVERVSQLQLDFEPSYQTHVIHHVNLIRERQGLVYDDRRLVVVHVKCDACRATHDFYFTPAAETTAG